MSLRVDSTSRVNIQRDTIPVEEKVKRRLMFGDERGFLQWGTALSKHDFSSVTTENIFIIVEYALTSSQDLLPRALGENRSIRDKILTIPKIRDYVLKRKDLHKGAFFDAITEDSRINHLIITPTIVNPIPTIKIEVKKPINGAKDKHINGKALLGGLSGSPISTRRSAQAHLPITISTPLANISSPSPQAQVSLSKPVPEPIKKVTINELRAAKQAPTKPTAPSTQLPEPIQQQLPGDLRSTIPKEETPYIFDLYDYLKSAPTQRTHINKSCIGFILIRSEEAKRAIIHVAKLEENKDDPFLIKVGRNINPASLEQSEIDELSAWVKSHIEHSFSKGLIKHKVLKFTL